MIPIGCKPPKKAAEIPWKPMAGVVEASLHEVKPFWRLNEAAKPARAPEIAVAIKIFLTLLIPAYFAALLFKPVALSS